MEELNHQASKSLKGTWDSDGWADLDQDAFGRVDVDLKLAGLVDRRVEKGKEALGKILTAVTMGHLKLGQT